MLCSEEERNTCNVEKMGCKGCFFYGITEEEKETIERVKEQNELMINKMNKGLSNDINVLLKIIDIQEERIKYLVNCREIENIRKNYIEFEGER